MGCADRQHRNPLDPDSQNTGPEDVLQNLQVVAGNAEVVLSWDYSYFDDVVGHQLYRRVGSATFKLRTPLSAETLEFVDTEVENDTTYDYCLTLQIEGEDERPTLQIEDADGVLRKGFIRATPGEEVCWVGDRASGLVWKISPDGRSAQFGRGRFPALEGLALNRRDGSVWVSDRLVEGLSRIPADGSEETEFLRADLGEAGDLSIDSQEGIAWVVDTQHKQVKWFELAGAADSLDLKVVDAHFIDPSRLSAWDDHCWIVDGPAGRVLLYGRDGKSRVEFGDLEQAGRVAAKSADLAWVLVRGGEGLVRLDATTEEKREVELPFERARTLAVDRLSGDCWVLGDADVVVFSRAGVLLQHRTGISGGQGLALDEVHQKVWIGQVGSLGKFTAEVRTLAFLGGFSTPFLLEVDPGSF